MGRECFEGNLGEGDSRSTLRGWIMKRRQEHFAERMDSLWLHAPRGGT